MSAPSAETPGNNSSVRLSSIFVNSNDQLYHNAKKIKPLKGYSDIVMHGSPTELLVYDNDGVELSYNAKEAAELIILPATAKCTNPVGINFVCFRCRPCLATARLRPPPQHTKFLLDILCTFCCSGEYKNSREFCGKPIRLIACQTGALKEGIAQQLADELGVNVLAPTEIVNVDIFGNMFISDNDILFEIWNQSPLEEHIKIHQTGKWVEFKPRR